MKNILLEDLAKSCGCFISDLNYLKNSQFITLILRSVETEAYSLQEWDYALSYIFNESLYFDSYLSIFHFIDRLHKRNQLQ